jgi:cyclic pyranopterin phosphate synthase
MKQLATTAPLIDTFNRVHTDLRVSLTDRCSLRCTYCMPESGMQWLSNNNILSADEIETIVGTFVGLGVTTVRLTGGEPLLRHDLVDIVRRIAALKTPGGAPVAVSMTTNGIGLPERIGELEAAGLSRINISLDTLRPERFHELTKRDRLPDVLAGIEAARLSSLAPVKINAVAMRGVNDDELCDLVDFARSIGAQIRFIEHMPLDISHSWRRENLLSGQEIHEILSTRFVLAEAHDRGTAPAELFTIDGGPDQVGIIASVTAPFCASCDRIRLTADGQVRNCLFAKEESDLRDQLRAGAEPTALESIVRASITAKRAGHGISDPEFTQPDRGMNAIGG